MKSFAWTLHQIVLILRCGFEADALMSAVTFVDLIGKLLTETGKNLQVVERVRSNLLTSLNQHREKSKTVQFFLSFVMGDYSLLEFRFFNMLFNLCFPAIYPSLEKVLEDPDIQDDSRLFFIHKQFLTQICRIMLDVDKFPDEYLTSLCSMTALIEYPDLVPFWGFARYMIDMFKNSHRRFHGLVKNILVIAGGGDIDHISSQRFIVFMRMVDPLRSDAEIKRLWATLGLFEGLSMEAVEVKRSTLLKFCGDQPGLCRRLTHLPYTEKFTHDFHAMPEPVANLFFFMRRRFTEFLPKFLAEIPTDIKEQLIRHILRFRSSFLKLDVSTAVMSYRHILQVIDLKMTEKIPFQFVNQSARPDDIERITNHVMMRECLASVLVRVPGLAIDEEAVVSRELAICAKANHAEGSEPPVAQDA
jgi:hypothetical protein